MARERWEKTPIARKNMKRITLVFITIVFMFIDATSINNIGTRPSSLGYVHQYYSHIGISLNQLSLTSTFLFFNELEE